MEVKGAHHIFGYTNILQNIFFCVQQKKEIQIGLQKVSKCWQNSHFGVNYPLNKYITK